MPRGCIIANDVLEASLPSAVEYLPLADSLCQAFCIWSGLTKVASDDIAMAVVEAATNAAVHGNKCDRSKKVKLVLRKLPAEIAVEVTDQGPGFNPACVANPLEAANMLKECGRGIHIMKHIMDRVEFDFPPEGGTRVRMSKRIRCGKGRVLGVDYGERRLGLALSDELCIIAQPVKAIDRAGTKDAIGDICSLLRPNDVGEIVVGMPLTLKGEEARSASVVRAFVRDLAERSGLPVVTWDERFSTKQGERALIESGMRRQQRKRTVDSVAAALVLQSYLDSRKGA